MSRAYLISSRALWRRREAFRKTRHTAALQRNDTAGVKKWGDLLREARAMVVKRNADLAAISGPRIITAAQLGLTFQDLFGPLGAEVHVTGHYSAGARAHDAAEGRDRAQSFHAQHRNQSWGGSGYHYLISDDGTLFCLRPTRLKGAHVGGHNSNNIGVNMPGTTGDKPTDAQRRTYAWLLDHAHSRALPAAHRTDRKLRAARRHGHNSWSGHHSNGCPGLFKPLFVNGA